MLYVEQTKTIQYQHTSVSVIMKINEKNVSMVLLY